MILTGERQVAPSLDGIRRDHVARYEWAAERLPARSRVVDFACGVGYGTQLLADAGHVATGYDQSAEAVGYARKFYPRAEYRQARDTCPLRQFDAAVCFETIEHVDDPHALLESLRGGNLLLASVPNEAVMPFGAGFAFHKRHYTRGQFAELLAETGWRPVEWWGQRDDQSSVERDLEGRTLIVVAERCEVPAQDTARVETIRQRAAQPRHESADWPVPEHVALLGLGPSLDQYLEIVKRAGGKHAYCDETWGINALGGVFQCDRVFHMDDVRIQEIRAAARPQSNIARMLEWMRAHPGPIITSRAHPDYPGLVEFPLEDALNNLGAAYFNSTAAYAVGYAILLGVKKLSIFGCDYTYPNAHDAEKGRACLEYWLGVGAARGLRVTVAKTSTLLDAMQSQEDRLYGYDTLDLTIRTEGNRACLDIVERERLPTAEEIEARYDHARHPNGIVDAR